MAVAAVVAQDCVTTALVAIETYAAHPNSEQALRVNTDNMEAFARVLLLAVVVPRRTLSANTTAAPALPAFVTPDCTFVSDASLDLNVSIAINARCRAVLAAQYVTFAGTRAAYTNDRCCGVFNASENIAKADVCYSSQAEGIALAMIHTVRLPNETFFADLQDPTKKRAVRLRTNLENAWNTLCLTSDTMRGWGFERATPIAFGNSNSSVLAAVLVQFGPDGADVSPDDYLQMWDQLTANGSVGNIALDSDTINNVSAPDPCPAPSTLKARMSGALWASANGTSSVPMGSSLLLTCPAGKRLSSHDDGLGRDDNTFAVMCNVLQVYDEPSVYPACVSWCPADLPDAPDYSGLLPVAPDNPVPVNGTASYACNDSSEGVNQGSSAQFDVLCLANSSYDVPADDQWPVCGVRTSTFYPVIPPAISSMLGNADADMNYRGQVTQWSDSFTPMQIPNWIKLTTIPALIGLLIGLTLICCCTHKNSPLFKLCAEEPEEPYHRI